MLDNVVKLSVNGVFAQRRTHEHRRLGSDAVIAVLKFNLGGVIR